MGSLDGEVAVVTGARHGIGAAIARGLADAGARVAVTHHDQEVAEGLAAELGEEHAGFALDVRSTESVDAAAAAVAERLGEPTVLVNSAGVNKIGPAESFTDDEWNAILDVNLTGLYRCCRAFGARMLGGPAAAASSTSRRSSARRWACRAGRPTARARQASSA